MKVSKISVNRQIEHQSSISGKRMENNFADQFGSALKREMNDQLNELLGSIKKKGKQVIDSKSIIAVREYKNYIKQFLSMILSNTYHVDHMRSTFNGNLSTLVSVINEELDKLVQLILEQEKDTINIVNSIERIEGLLVDIYK